MCPKYCTEHTYTKQLWYFIWQPYSGGSVSLRLLWSYPVKEQQQDDHRAKLRHSTHPKGRYVFLLAPFPKLSKIPCCSGRVRGSVHGGVVNHYLPGREVKVSFHIKWRRSKIQLGRRSSRPAGIWNLTPSTPRAGWATPATPSQGRRQPCGLETQRTPALLEQPQKAYRAEQTHREIYRGGRNRKRAR